MDDGWVDSVVDVARQCNKLFSKHTCGVCNLYATRQVEFEEEMTSPVERAFRKTFRMLDQLNVDEHRQVLFDEESVFTTASLRSDERNDAPSVMTQRTQ